MEMTHHVAYKYVADPYMNSYDTTPETDWQQQHSSLPEPISLCHSPSSSDEEGDSGKGHNTKFGKKIRSFAYGICEHVKLGPKLSETVKEKLSFGARIIQMGGRRNTFKQIFGVNEGEELLKASQCYYLSISSSTTASPIPGLLFISTQKLAFCSERFISVSCDATATGQVVRTPDKVQIPIRNIKEAIQTENVNKPQQKYIEIVTEDDFKFRFMGFLRYEKACRNLKKAIPITKKGLDSHH